MKIDWDRFKAGRFAVWCPREEEAVDFLNECAEREIEGVFGGKIERRDSRPNHNKENCCFAHSLSHPLGPGLENCDLEWYESLGCHVVCWNVEPAKLAEPTESDSVAEVKSTNDDSTNEIDWRAFVFGSLSIRCDAEEKAIDFLERMIRADVKWSNGDALDAQETKWNRHRHQTSYAFENGGFLCSKDKYCESKGRCVVDWKIETLMEDAK